jgi:hypothetical protein
MKKRIFMMQGLENRDGVEGDFFTWWVRPWIQGVVVEYVGRWDKG